MRSIKFRAWNEQMKHMISWVSVKKNFRQYLERKNLPINSHSNYAYNNGKDTYILMQYIELKDCNGKEIYEGDIVNTFDLYNNRNVVCYICWDKRCLGFALKVVSEPELDERFAIFDDFKLELIGNIFETPELLQGAIIENVGGDD